LVPSVPTHLVVPLAYPLDLSLLLADKRIEALEIDLLAVRVLYGPDEGCERLEVLRSGGGRVEGDLQR
jgi:hypothetical protein